MGQRFVFKNIDHQQKFESTGYLVLNKFFSITVLNKLDKLYSDTLPLAQVNECFFTTNWSPNEAYREKINEGVYEILFPQLQNLFDSYKSILGYFLSKKPSVNSAVAPHRDWTLIDEDTCSSVIAWIPLNDMTKKNGCIQVLEGSHRYSVKVRGSNIEQNHTFFSKTEMKDLMLCAGDLLLFDQKLIHASPPNISSQTRIAAGMALIPEEEHPKHYMYSIEEQKIYLLDMKDDFLIRTYFSRSEPEKLQERMIKVCLQKKEYQLK